MILQHAPEGTIAIKQPDHAAFACFLLEHWASNNFGNTEQREDILLATREHDCGWEAYEEHPPLDPATRLPIPFNQITPETALEVWRRATGRFLERNKFVALLIAHHAYSVYELTRKRNPAWKAFFTEFAQLRAGLRTELGIDHPALEHAYSFLRMADSFSLAWCTNGTLGAERPESYAGFQFRREGEQFQFKPFPFDSKELEYQLPIYPMRDGGYANNEELAADLVTPQAARVVLVPMRKHR